MYISTISSHRQHQETEEAEGGGAEEVEEQGPRASILVPIQ